MKIIYDRWHDEYGILKNGVITFYDEANREYDSAFYRTFGEERYIIIKTIKSFIKFKGLN